MSKLRIFSALAILSIVSSSLAAVEVKKIIIDSFDLFQKGAFSSTRLDQQGRLNIGPGSSFITGPAREYYLCFDINEQGDILLGCGHGAEVFRIGNQDKKPISIFKSEEPDVHAVLQHKSGSVIVATGPSGKLYSLDSKGNSTILFDPKERFIWNMLEDQDGSIIVAVGGSGAVYRVTLSGKASKLFETDDPHITTLHLSPDNILYAGSGERGIIYTITGKKTKVLYDSGYKEIRGITSDNKGNVYFAATHFADETRKQRETEPGQVKSTSKGAPSPGLRSVVFIHRTNGNIEEIFSLRNETIYDLDFDLKAQHLLVATGNSGRVFEVRPNGEYAIVFESEAAQVYRVSTKGPGATMLTNNSAGIVRLNDTINSSGTYTSDIFDLSIQSHIGKLYWQDYKPENAQVAVSVRAGNVGKPDNTWTEWLPPFLSGDGSATNLSGYRFVQFNVNLKSSSSGKEPFLEQLALYYLQNNLTPRLTSVQISPRFMKKEEPAAKPEEKKLPDSKAVNPRDLIVTWTSQDPNNDPLSFDLMLNPVNSSKWFPFKTDLKQNSAVIPSGLYQDGRYRIKIIASDAPGNPPNMAKSAELVSTPFIIDSTPPDITQFTAEGNQIRFTIQDSTSVIRLVQFSWDGETWFPLFPDDLISDSGIESYSIKATSAKKILFIRAEDEFGNGKVYQKDIK